MLLNGATQGMQALQPRLGELQLPLYIVHGTRDLTTSLAAVELLAARAASGDITFNKVEGAAQGEGRPTGGEFEHALCRRCGPSSVCNAHG